MSTREVFTDAVRVVLVERKDKPGLFGVAMRGKRVVPLPVGYDGRTSVRWINGFVFVAHPTLPPLLADTTTGKTSPCDADTIERVKADVKRELRLSASTRIIH